MAQKKLKPDKPVNLEKDSFENLQLKKRIAELTNFERTFSDNMGQQQPTPNFKGKR